MTKKTKPIDANKSVTLGEHYISLEFIMAVGRMTINFSHLENVMSMFCLTFIKNEYGQIFIAEYTFKQLTSVIRSLLIKCNNFDNFKNDFQRIKHIEEKRNQIIHSIYGQNENEEVTIRSKSRNRDTGFKQVREEINAVYVDELANEMNELSDSIAIKTLELNHIGVLDI